MEFGWAPSFLTPRVRLPRRGPLRFQNPTMSEVGQIEKQTQARIVALFRDRLGYRYLGNWIDRAGNANIEPELLRAWLKRRGVANILVTRALHELHRVASDTSRHSAIDVTSSACLSRVPPRRHCSTLDAAVNSHTWLFFLAVRWITDKR